MSLMIDTDEVSAVLLVDGWHEVADESFDLDSYEYVWGSRKNLLLHGGGSNGICATGFAFQEKGQPGPDRIYGPLTAILAVRTKGEK